jgi:hypothetical protein
VVADGSPGDARWRGQGLTVLLVLLLVLQRFVVPIGSTPIPLVLPVAYAAVALLLVAGHLVIDRLRLELFVIALGLCTAATVLAAMRGANPLSVTSLGMLCAVYLVWVLRAAPGHRDALVHVGRSFVRAMLVLAGIGVAQLTMQFSGLWQYQDYIGEFVPPDFIAGTYNTNVPLAFGSAIHKANAFVFLEPSYLSQFAALAAIVAVVLRAPAWQILLLLCGVFSAVSGTGILLLLAGGVLVLFRASHLVRPAHIVALGALAVGVLLSPVAPLLLSRVDEPGQVGSSGYLRFVQPYQEVAQGLQDAPLRYLLGAGTGSVERLLASGGRGEELGQAVVYTIVPKLVFEYGLIAGGVFVLFILVAVLERGAWRVVPGSLVVMTFLLSGALLQPHTSFLVWILAVVWTGQRPAPGRSGVGLRDAVRRRSPAGGIGAAGGSEPGAVDQLHGRA